MQIMDALFGCWHRRTSFPITAKGQRVQAASGAKTYVVCLECGREFAYDWQKMRILSPRQDKAHRLRPHMVANG